MGYYTEYSLMVRNVTPDNFDRLNEAIAGKAAEVFDDAFLDSKNNAKYWPKEPVKWYSHDEDMTSISKMFPESIFKLSGSGEDCDDLWDCYYKNGEKEFCPWAPMSPKRINW